MSDKGPKVEVSFAATKAFCERWPREAEKQQVAFETETWQKDKCEQAHKEIEAKIMPEKEPMIPLNEAIGAVAAVSFLTFCVGFLAGMALAYFTTKPA